MRRRGGAHADQELPRRSGTHRARRAARSRGFPPVSRIHGSRPRRQGGRYVRDRRALAEFQARARASPDDGLQGPGSARPRARGAHQAASRSGSEGDRPLALVARPDRRGEEAAPRAAAPARSLRVRGRPCAPLHHRETSGDTPVFERSTLPYAAYLPPAPFDEDQTGFFYVTPIDLSRRKEEQEQQLEGHNYAGLPLTVVHEAFPGHHLQLCHANRSGSRLRRLADSNVFAEGWALYCEDLMHEQGFFVDRITRLYQLKDLLWRACRVVIDVGLHTGTMSFMQAVDYLVDQAMLERVNAVIEVKRYTMTPTQPMSYLVGKLELLAIRRDAEQRLGDRFSLAEFHRALLASGTLQPALVREELKARLA
ncbi:MAG: DUF885 domain-containing protein [Candidatus Eisenbacteria bacterium]|uniref:DUF885 domain-containing protein n=1 Tax=Eiseniibacteriota bacterium TaxID=2212470 RepID=A0A538TKL3_UNCEI|nr:MAG: DUF885 domain-containing protein [Candidatus Eisenbacteria bacterium]